jgi:phosphoglycerol transferase MdoB-like AlkP superfamily enzyme
MTPLPRFSISNASFLKCFIPFAKLAFGLFTAFRMFVLFSVWREIGVNSPYEAIVALILGVAYDVSIIVYMSTPLIVISAIFPPLRNQRRLTALFRKVAFAWLVLALFALLFTTIAEFTFWDEFRSRFNFIAVDYLVYTHDVIRNIYESYPLVWAIIGVIAVCVAIAMQILRTHKPTIHEGLSLKSRAIYLTGIAALTALNYLFFPTSLASRVKQIGLQEAAKNGWYAFATAYFANELEYQKFYPTQPEDQNFALIRKKMADEGATLLPDKHDIARLIRSNKAPHNYNVVLVGMESMSAQFMYAFGNRENITPNLDRIAREGLFFDNIFATGTRTVRGLEALALSIPPTPGQSIVRRPENGGLYNISNYFSDRGYTTEFLYGGNSYFDNMRTFFSGNGMTVFDRADFAENEITFANAWGVCDEDLFDMSIRRADRAYHAGKKFFQFVMTASNHRPYTYPQKIDIRSGEGRMGAVKYSDYAIGAFLEKAKDKPWFKNTIFIFVADHDAAVAGKDEVPLIDYRIPLMFYAPGIIAPRKSSLLGSQIDVAPTLLGLLNASYESHFFGHDLTQVTPPIEPRAFIGNYQKVGYFKDPTFILLGPKNKIEQFNKLGSDAQTEEPVSQKLMTDEAIAYYQTASALYGNGKLKRKTHSPIATSAQ